VTLLVNPDQKSAKLSYKDIPYVAKGQIACLYLGDRLVGSGIIEETYDETGQKIPY
jgi:tRNA U34 2-thiouridine synthase MnmA/TrmU